MDLPPALLEVAERELNETPETRRAGLQALRSRVEERGGAGSFAFPVDDETLVSYLRPCKFDVDKAWKKLTNMDAFFKDNKQHAEGTDVAKLREWYGQGFMRILRGKSKAGAVVNLFYPARMKPFDDPYIMVKWNMWVMPKMLKDQHLQVNGMLIVEDFEDFSLWNMMVMQRNVPRDLMKKNMHFLQECSPMRLKGIYIINQPMYMSFLWAMARPFMSAKLRSRIHFLGKNYKEQLDAVVDSTVLPPDLGGTLQEDMFVWFDELVAAHPEETTAEAEDPQAAASASAVASAAAEATP